MIASTSAILLPTPNQASLEAALHQALTTRRYTRWESPVPRGYRLRRDELIEAGTRWGACGPLGLIVPINVDVVFRLACWMSATSGAPPLVAMRHYKGLAPVMKVYVAGEPKWKDGEDDDLEVASPS